MSLTKFQKSFLLYEISKSRDGLNSTEYYSSNEPLACTESFYLGFRVRLACLDHPHSPAWIAFFSEGKKCFNSTVILSSLRTEKGEELSVYGIFSLGMVFFFFLFFLALCEHNWNIELKKGLKQPSMYTRASLEREKVMARKEKKKMVSLSFLK